ncbi:protein mono-ADP-ribosyltransferase PARP14-like isoform X2 [Ruditapes philippinarum]|uniref:protein mono-ADP-ribosyltransferase PARP14-like isoform X2 n=1 Tax=Ruditapes philippinarum TaxID=129788 RepID=UPI00295AF0A3|nr:protein mono-ADP-ribosyltransferase PARP14-like isoform X2 [Ruditapes philippinarum]
MMFDPQSGQYFQAPGFPGMQLPPESHRHSPGNQRGPPPPYNGQQSTEVKSPRGDHNDGEGSQAVADQDFEYEKIQAKRNREQQSMNNEEEEPADPEPENREPSEPETPEENQTKIVVSNLPSTAHDEYLQMFFENKRKFKGCDVYSVEMDEDGTSAIIEFETPEAVDIVLSKCPLKMMGREVEISKFEPPPPVLLCTVEVTGPCSLVSEDHLEMLEMYFENSKRSGGGDVVDIEFDTVNNMVLVTFESEDVAQKVAEKGRHVIKNEKLNVKVHIPSKKSKKPDDVEEEKQEEEEEETKPSNTIKVKGINKSASRDTVEFYFENSRRSGGGEIETIKSDDEDEDVLYITFKSTEVAESVLERTHKLEGKSLNVSLYVPPVAPPSYDNKILLKGLQASTTQDCLFNFIEAKSGCLPETMDYHSEQEDVAMVTFSETPDFKKLESAFDKYKLEGASLKICPVPISNCIIVANLASEVTKDTIEFYFENKRKSGGGQVDKVVMNEDDTCLVYFSDYMVIDDVLEKEHTLSKQLLDVKRYQECLGRPEGEVAERVLRIPEDIVLKNVDAQKLKFLKHSKVNRMGIEKQLDSCYATIVWPEDGGEVIIKCTLTNEIKDCFKLIKTWKNTAVENFEDFMKLIIVKKVQILQDIWGKVIEELQKFNIENPEAVAIFVDKNESVITVVGNKNVAEDLSTKIENMTREVMAEVEKEREKIKETITTLKNIETRMLLADKFPTDVEKQFPDLKVKINQNKNEIVFEGPLGQVRDAKLKMYELKTRFAVDRSEKISELAAGLLILKQTKEHVVKKLKASRVTAVWDTVDGYLEVYCTSQDQIQLCVNVIRSCIIEHTVALKKAAKTVVNSEKWQTKVDELHGYHAGKCFIKVSDDSCKVQICATDDIANEILDNVKIFLRQNTVVEAKVPCTKNVHRLIERHHKNEISNIAKGLTNYNVQISSVAEYGGFEVRGTEDGLHQAVQQLHQLLLKVKQKEHIMTKPGLSKHMQTPKGKDNLNTIESMHQCVVAVKGDNDEGEITDNPYDTVPFGSDVKDNIGVKGVKIVAYSKVYDCRNVYTMLGDMTELTVDMIVNSADDKLSLTGGLGNAIVKKGGKNIQKECADYIRDNDRLDDGDAFVSTAGSLKASAIVHVRGPVWRGGMKQEDEMLTDAIFKCLQQATTRDLTSVAIPALSCGTYGYPVRKATTVIVAAVKNFFREVQESTVTDIYLCDMKSNTVEAFNEAMSNEFGATNVKKYIDNLDSIRQPSRRFSRADSDDENPYIKPYILDTDQEDDDYYQSSSNLAPPSGKAPPLPKGRPPQKTTKIGNISVSVVKGEIAKQKVDVIVNTTAKNLDLKNGAVSASLLKTGGMELQQEVTKKYPNGIKDGEIAVTSGQSLRCDIVVHSSLANWDGKKDAQCKQALHKLMKDCMDEAENQGKTSIAFPAIGTGNLGFPRDIVATEMFSAVSKFSDSNPSSSLREVSFIVYQKDFQTIQAFENEARRWSTGKRGATGGREGRQYDLYQDLQGRFPRKPSAGSENEDEENLYESLDDVDGSKNDDGAYKFGSLKILVQQGDITAQNTECIVNSSNEALDLSRGNVSQAILKKGGQTLEKEVNDKRKKMKKEHLVVTSAPGMSCQKIIHVVAKETAQEWQDIIEKCLFKADKEHMKDIAFPALGTGIQMDASIIATTMAKAIMNFAKTDPKHLQEVRLVIFQKQMVEDFDKAISKAGKPNEGWGGKLVRSVKDWFGGGEQEQTSRQQTKKKPAKNKDANKVTFIILAMSENIIEQAISKLESCLDKEITSSNFNDSIIKNMNDQQIMEIKNVATKHHLDIKVESSKGIIQISGISANVSKAADNIHRILRHAVTVEQERKTADLMINLVQWSYIENEDTGQTLKPYDKELNYKIESAYLSKADCVKFRADKINYVLDFSKMEEYPEDDQNDTVTVIRRDLVKQGAFEAPALWADMTGNLRVVVLQPTCPEYTDIAQKFTTSSGGTFTVVKIERIQNKTLWSQYAAKKKQLEDQNPPNTTNERLLWHGTAVEAVDKINAHGFNRSYCGKNATVFGDGVYFAVNASYSCSDTYSRPASGVKRMYYCRVLTGEFTQGTRGMRVAPTKGGTGSTAIFDSVVDRQATPGMFIIFHDTQAYPEYLISFKPK